MDPLAKNTEGAGSGSGSSQRLMSVDALRGFDMFWILGADSLARGISALSNNAVTRGIAKQLEHKDWSGFAFYDLIFPLFVFIVGVSTVFSLEKIVAREGKGAAMKRVIWRGILLYIMGIIYSGGFVNEWPDIRLLGVLNRIAICYTATGLLFIHFGLKARVGIFASLLIGYWALMTFVPVPEIGAGVFDKGRNLANYLDFKYLPGKRWDGNWDPEGLLSTLPAIGTCLLGTFCGALLKSSSIDGSRKVRLLLVGGAVCAGLGWLWSLQFPVVKKIWTSSFVLVAGGYSAMLLGTFYSIVDVWKYQKWCLPFVWIGSNSITVYMAKNIVDFRKLATRFAGGDVKAFLDTTFTKGMGEFVIAIVAVSIGVLFCRFLYNRKIFLRL